MTSHFTLFVVSGCQCCQYRNTNAITMKLTHHYRHITLMHGIRSSKKTKRHFYTCQNVKLKGVGAYRTAGL